VTRAEWTDEWRSARILYGAERRAALRGDREASNRAFLAWCQWATVAGAIRPGARARIVRGQSLALGLAHTALPSVRAGLDTFRPDIRRKLASVRA
jgi:hypothetical protein